MSQLKICLVSSSGGHFEQLKKLAFLEEKYKCFWIVEKVNGIDIKKNCKYLAQQDRYKWYFVFILLINAICSVYYAFKLRPKVVISTGAGSVLIFCFISKLLGAKVIFIESYAKRKSPTITGKIIYLFADKFYVQWEEMMDIYPKAEYRGTIY